MQDNTIVLRYLLSFFIYHAPLRSGYPALKKVKEVKHTIPRHPEPQAFLQSTVLTPIPVDAIYHTRLVPRTLVVDHRALRPPEEALAALAGDDTVVDSAALVSAHLAGDDFDLSCEEKKY